jgi:transcription initiation factor TFIIIB Brf1 subunit/transcription initiation factor TFIIB
VELEILTGKSPSTIASAAIYICCQMNKVLKSYRDISQVSKMAETTIKKCCKEMWKHKVLLFPDIPMEALDDQVKF